MNPAFTQYLAKQLVAIDSAGTTKRERIINTPQGTMVQANGHARVLNMCANNYLGLSQHPDVKKAAHEALDRWGYGLASVRFFHTVLLLFCMLTVTTAHSGARHAIWAPAPGGSFLRVQTADESVAGCFSVRGMGVCG